VAETGESTSAKNRNLAAKWIIYVSTALICAVVVLLNRKVLGQPATVPGFVYRLPALNAILNGTCSILLAFSYRAIRGGHITRHKKLNISAFVLSSLFLISYITAHYFIPDTRFGDLDHNGILGPSETAKVEFIKPVYLFTLLTHILLAVIVLPLVLLSFYYGLTDQRKHHRRITRFSFPIWLYVTVSGVVVYLMISPYYAF
jgi:putative membrane protein